MKIKINKGNQMTLFTYLCYSRFFLSRIMQSIIDKPLLVLHQYNVVGVLETFGSVEETEQLYKIILKKLLILLFLASVFITPSSSYAKNILLSMSADFNQLRHTRNDSKNIINAFQHLYGRHLIVHDIHNVTPSKYRKAIQNIKKQLHKNDHLIIYFSGHGTTIPDISGDERDGLDEALVGFSQNTSVSLNQLILDDELSSDLKMLNPTELTVILDTCLSGGMQKALTRPLGVSKYTYNNIKINNNNRRKIFVAQDGTEGIIDQVRGVLIAASSEGEVAMEYNNRNIRGGVFTFYFVNALRNTRDIKRAFYQAREDVMKITNKQQTPHIYSYY